MKTAVDLFAGAGGWTIAAESIGVQVLAAVNHWKMAVDSHALNHPNTRHVCQDATLMDPYDMPDHDVLIASPSCTGHTRARGKDRPHHDKARATAWCVVDVAEAKRPAKLVVENVPDFMRWELYDLWKMALAKLGYSLTENVLDASEFGVPQERRRLYVVGILGKRAPVIESPKLPKVPASSIIQWDAGTWSPVRRRGRARRTLRKIDATRELLGDRFLLPFYGNTLIGRSLERPIGTITTHDRYALVDGDRMRMLTAGEYKTGMSFPPSYQLAGTHRDQVKMLGNAVCPLKAAEILRQLRAA